MTINKGNYYDYINKIGVENLPEAVREFHYLIDSATNQGQDWSIYPAQKVAFDAQFNLLETVWNARNATEPQAEVKNTNETKKEITHTERKQKERVTHHHQEKPKSKPEVKHHTAKSHHVHSGKHYRIKLPEVNVRAKELETIHPEITFIRRFALLHGKTKTKKEILGFIKTIQRAIAEHRITKKSKHAKTINEIQIWLINRFKKGDESKPIKFDTKNLVRFLKIAKSESILPSVRFIKSFVTMQEKPVTKDQVLKFNNRIVAAIKDKLITAKDKYFKHLKTITAALNRFYSGKESSGMLSVSPVQLSGLNGVLEGCGCHRLNDFEDEETVNEESDLSGVEKDDGVMSVDEARKIQFRPVALTGEWLKLIGKMCLPTHFLVYGLGGSGKTSFVLLFTQYLSRLGYKILYVAREQYNTPTFTELLNRLNIQVGDNFKIVKDLDVLNPHNFDFVVIDSKDDMDIQLQNFVELKEKYPEQSFLIISQATKTGNFVGNGRWRNVVDVMVYAENGVIRTGRDKNRWGGAGEMRIHS